MFIINYNLQIVINKIFIMNYITYLHDYYTILIVYSLMLCKMCKKLLNTEIKNIFENSLSRQNHISHVRKIKSSLFHDYK